TVPVPSRNFPGPPSRTCGARRATRDRLRRPTFSAPRCRSPHLPTSGAPVTSWSTARRAARAGRRTSRPGRRAPLRPDRRQGRDGDLRRTIALALWPVLVVSSIAAVLTLGFAPQLSRLFVHGRGSVHRDALVPYLRLMAPFLPLAAASGVILAGTRGFGTMVP